MYDQWLELLKFEEGFRAKAYPDKGGVWTIGFGHTGPDVQRGQRITRERGVELLQEDMKEALQQAIGLSPTLANADTVRLLAVADFCFNAGPHKYQTSTLKKKVDRQRWAEAAAQNAKWVYGYNTVTKTKEKMGGLIRRRAKTSAWLLNGDQNG